MRSILFAALALFAMPALADPKAPIEKIEPEVAVPAATPDNTLVLQTSAGGPVMIQLRPDKAPNSVARVKQLVRAGFYNGLLFHRVIDGFMAQGGDPKGDGTGGSDLPDLKAEFNDLPHLRGTVAMARSQSPDSANSQFYIMFQPRFSLDKSYTVIGRVIGGMAAVDAIEKGEPPANPTRITKVYVQADGPDAAPVPLPATAAAPPPAAAPLAPAEAPAPAAPSPAAEGAPAAAAPAPAAPAPAPQGAGAQQ